VNVEVDPQMLLQHAIHPTVTECAYELGFVRLDITTPKTSTHLSSQEMVWVEGEADHSVQRG
jgi:hypothetical protein